MGATAAILAFVHIYCSNPDLTLSIIEVETGFRNVVSKEGSTGLMQVKPETARWIGCRANTTKKLLDVELNVKCGCKYLKRLQKRYKHKDDVIAAYNAGSAIRCKVGVLNNGKKCRIGKYINQGYVDKVNKVLKRGQK